MLSFGEVADIIHVEDGDLFDLADRIVSREIDHIDQVFRMRHADGPLGLGARPRPGRSTPRRRRSS